MHHVVDHLVHPMYQILTDHLPVFGEWMGVCMGVLHRNGEVVVVA